MRKKPFSNVAISWCGENLQKSVRGILDMLGGISKFVKKGDTVFIKPNLTANMPCSTGGTTDALFVEAVVSIVKEAEPSRIIVGECSGNETRTMEGLINHGYADMCARQGVELVDLDYAEFVDYKLEDPLYRDIVRLPKVFLDCGVFISVPVMKNHMGAGITVALKNNFGFIPDMDKMQAHRDNAIEEIVADIARVKPANLVIVDGRLGAEGIAGGTDFTRPIEVGIVYASDDPVAADAVSARLMRQNTRVRYIQWASEKGVGNDNMDYINIHGLSIEEAGKKFMSPAEQIEAEAGGKVRIHELSPCSRCRAVGEGGVSRFSKNPNALLKPVDIVIGPGKWEASAATNPHTILLGDCIRGEYREKGVWIGGCPASGEEFGKAVSCAGIVCTQCAQLAEKLVGEYTPDKLEAIRILASSRSVFVGKGNNAMMDDYLLAIGECMKGYCRYHKRRTYKLFGINTDEYIAFVDKCPAGEADVRQALDDLLERRQKAGKRL